VIAYGDEDVLAGTVEVAGAELGGPDVNVGVAPPHAETIARIRMSSTDRTPARMCYLLG